MTTMDAFVINDHAYIKACAENFKRYAMSIDIRKRIRDSQRYLRSLGLVSQPPPPVIEPTEPQPYAPNPTTGYNMLGVEIAAWLRKHKQGGRFAVVADGIGRNKKSVRQQLERMIERGEVVKYKVEKKVYYRLAERQVVR